MHRSKKIYKKELLFLLRAILIHDMIDTSEQKYFQKSKKINIFMKPFREKSGIYRCKTKASDTRW